MGRKKLPPSEQIGPDLVNTPPAQIAAEEALMLKAETIAQKMNEEKEFVSQILGQIQMSDAFAKFSRTVRTSKLAFVKENKLYRALKGKKIPDRPEFLSGTWGEFCSLLGRSVDQIDCDIANLRAFGEQALESMSRMGIGYRELRQFRKLPEDQKTALIEVAKEGDKESFLDLAEDLIARHTKEKDALQKQLDDAAGDLKATERLLAEKRQETEALKEKRVREELTPPTWDERIAKMKMQLATWKALSEEALGNQASGIVALDEYITQTVTAAPDYDPEAYIPLPLPVKTMLLDLNETLNRVALLAKTALDDLHMRFGGEISEALSHMPVEETEEE